MIHHIVPLGVILNALSGSSLFTAVVHCKSSNDQLVPPLLPLFSCRFQMREGVSENKTPILHTLRYVLFIHCIVVCVSEVSVL